MHLLTMVLYMVQPLARLFGRVSLGLTPWRRHGLQEISFPRTRTHSIWSENWQPPGKILEAIENSLREKGAFVFRGGNFDSWDLEIRGGLFGAICTRMAVEEHRSGKQMIRLKSWPRVSRLGFVLILFFSAPAILASMDQAWYVYIILGVSAAITAVRSFGDCAVATNSYLQTIQEKRDANS